MATLNIGGVKVKVSDDFLRMTPEQQQHFVKNTIPSQKLKGFEEKN